MLVRRKPLEEADFAEILERELIMGLHVRRLLSGGNRSAGPILAALVGADNAFDPDNLEEP